MLGDDDWLRYAVPKPYGGMFDKLDVRSLCLIRETLARTSGLADFAFAMQGLGSASIALFGSDDPEAALSAGSLRRHAHRRLRALRAGGRLRRRGDDDDRTPRRRFLCDRWCQNLDFQWRHRRALRALRPNRRGARRQRPLGLRRRRRRSRSRRLRAHPGDRPASAGIPALQELPRAEKPSARQTRRGLQDRHGDAGHLPLDRRCGRPRLRAPRPGRSAHPTRKAGLPSAASSPNSS